MINRYIIRQIVIAAGLVTAIATMVILLIRSLRLIDFVVNRGLPLEVLFAMTGLLVPTFISVVLPIGLFAGVLFVYNRLLSDSELIVMRAAGVSSLKLAQPALTVALVVMAIGYAMSLYVTPLSFAEFKAREFGYRNTYGSVLLQEGRFNNPTAGLTIFVRARSGANELLGLFIHDARDDTHPVTVMAERGQLLRGDEGGSRVVMFNGNRQELDAETGRLTLLYFDQNSIDLGLLNPHAERTWREPKERFIGELLHPGDSANDQYYATSMIAEGHRRLSAPLFTPAFVLIAIASLLSGEFSRRGQTVRVLVAIGIVGALQGVSLTLLNLAPKVPGVMPLFYVPPIAAMIMAVVVLGRRRGRVRRAGRTGLTPLGA